jgi:hypothetical protein
MQEGVADDEAGARTQAVESLAAGPSQFQRYTGHSFDAPPVLFTKTVVRAAVRKALVRVRGEGGERFVVCCKDTALEVLRDTGGGLQLFFEECVFGAVWALQALPLDILSTRPRQALPPWLRHGGCDQVCSLAALCPTQRPRCPARRGCVRSDGVPVLDAWRLACAALPARLCRAHGTVRSLTRRTS